MEPDIRSLEWMKLRSIDRKTMKTLGYVQVARSADLFEYGYQVAFWLRPGLVRSLLVEFKSRITAGSGKPVLPTVRTHLYRTVARVHRAIGAPVFRPGERFRKEIPGQGTLFHP